MIQEKTPKVSIGIPIYKGEVFLEETIKSILAQGYQDYEIILTDNNPGGVVKEIALAYSKKSDKIRYIIHDKNDGALQNWNSIIPLAKGEYFIYAGAHDLWSENFLSSLVETLDKNKQAVLAYAPSYWIDQDGKSIERHTDYADMSSLNIIARFNLLMWTGQEALYGLIRTSAIRKTRLQLEIVGSGAVWLSELSIFGEFLVDPLINRYRRINRAETSREERLDRYHQTLFRKPRKRFLPHWRIPFAYLGAALIGNIRPLQRVQLLLIGFISAILSNGNQMLADVSSLLKQLYLSLVKTKG